MLHAVFMSFSFTVYKHADLGELPVMWTSCTESDLMLAFWKSAAFKWWNFIVTTYLYIINFYSFRAVVLVQQSVFSMHADVSLTNT